MTKRLLSLLFLSAIGVSQRTTVRPQQTPKPTITLERTACLGACPIYALRIFPNGLVEYDGSQNVKVLGRAEANISKDEVQRIVRSFLAVGFLDFKDKYDRCRNSDGSYSMVSDLSSTIISLSLGERRKTVVDYICSPKVLAPLEEEVERVANVHRWIHEDDLKNKSTVAADTYRRIKPGFSKFMQAVGKGDAYTFEHQVSRGTDVNAQDETGWSALMVAAEMSQKYMVDRLIEVHANPLLKDRNEDTALIAAAISCQFPGIQQWEGQIVQALLKAGSSPNERTSQGDTPLILVARGGNSRCVQALLNGGADASLTDKNGNTALQIAIQAGEEPRNSTRAANFKKVVEFLQTASTNQSPR